VFAGCNEGLGEEFANVAASLSIRSLEKGLTPTMATFSIRFVKPAGISLAYFVDM